MTIFKNYHLLVSLTIGLLLISCNDVEPAVISNGFLTLPLWSDWKYKQLQGVDTIEGIFTNGCEEIGFSAGSLTSSDHTQSPDDLYYEEILIDGVPCKIVEIQGVHDIVLFLFFHKGVKEIEQGHLAIAGPGDVQKYISIFKSVHFL
ncbi:MAG: hypothetical protein ABIQ02_11115 [Saprospiraceae bacterium]